MVGRTPQVSVVVPCYNEEGNVEVLYGRLGAASQNFPDIDFRGHIRRQCVEGPRRRN